MKRPAGFSPGDRNLMLTLAYDGTDFKGWQRLPGAQRTVQETVEAALSGLLGEAINLMGAGRTDAGAHALGQTANFHTVNPMDLQFLAASLEALLPGDIYCVSIRACLPTFHARYRATEKTYSYLFREPSCGDPSLRRYSLGVERRIDDGLLLGAAGGLAGTRSFRAFTNAKADEAGFIRTISDVSMDRAGGIVRLAFRGDGFMLNQVRLMASAALLAASGRIRAADILAMLESGVRHPLVGSLGAYGLCLDSVAYRREDFLPEPEYGNPPDTLDFGARPAREAPSGLDGLPVRGGSADLPLGTELRSLGTNFSRGWLKKLAGAGLSSTSTLSLKGI